MTAWSLGLQRPSWSWSQSAGSESADSLSGLDGESPLSPGKRTCPGQQVDFGLEALEQRSRCLAAGLQTFREGTHSGWGDT